MPDHDQLFPELVRAALELDALPLDPDLLRDGRGFAARVPGEDHPLFVYLAAPPEPGDGIGLVAARGEYAFHDMTAMTRGDRLDHETVDTARFLNLSVTAAANVAPRFREGLVRAGLAVDGPRIPMFIVKEPGKAAGEITPAEARVFLYLLNGIRKSQSQGRLDLRPLDPARPVPTLTLGGEPDDPEIAWTEAVYEARPRPTAAHFPPNLAQLRTLKKFNSIWYVGYWFIPATIAGDDRSSQVLAVIDEANYRAEAVRHLLGRNLQEAAAMLLGIFNGDNDRGAKGIPKKIIFESKSLYDTVSPALGTIGVDCRLEPDNVILADFYAGLVEHMKDDVLARAAATIVEPIEPGFNPPDDDADGWTRLALHLSHRIARELASLKNPPDKALVRFFGDGDAAEYHLFETEEITGLSAFAEWYCFQYRAKKNGKTVIEKMLTEDLNPALRRLIEARQRGRFSIFMIEGVGPGAKIELRDVLAGEVLTVHDPGLTELATTEDAIPLKIYPAGQFNFCALAGPFLPGAAAPEAVDWLAIRGFKEDAPDPERSELLGLLFDWLDPAGAPDEDDEDEEDENEGIIAVYSVAKKSAVKKALRQRDDIEYDDEYDEYLWLPPEKPWLTEPEDDEPLAAIWFEDDELLFEADDLEVIDRGRLWLDLIPGVRFLHIEDDAEEDDDEYDDDLFEPVPDPSPEKVAAAQADLNQLYLDWLDEPRPSFGG